MPLGATTVTLEARAHDFGGNEATSSPVVVDVLPDPPPSVSITAPASGASALEGTSVAVTVAASDNTAVFRVELLIDGVLAGTDATAPYSFVVNLHLGHTELTLAARAVDSLGKTTTSDPVVITILPDPPPVVEITNPPDGTTLLETTNVSVTATATDNVSVASVRFLVNGVEATTDYSPPYGFDLTAPTGETSLLIEAVATDNLGRSASVQVVVSIEPDPGTTAGGRVLDASSTPVSGAAVDCYWDAGTTDAAGSFAIHDLPTMPGSIQCVADFTVVGGGLVHVMSAARPPVAGGVTDLGGPQTVALPALRRFLPRLLRDPERRRRAQPRHDRGLSAR